LGLDFTKDYRHKYFGLHDFDDSWPRHYLLGYSWSIQNRVEDLYSQLLFQIDTDDSLNVLWGDVGIIYITIPKTSLVAKRFQDVEMEMQF
jgi:uncharacterized protein YwqG